MLREREASKQLPIRLPNQVLADVNLRQQRRTSAHAATRPSLSSSLLQLNA